MAEGWNLFGTGQQQLGFEKMAPAAIRNVSKAVRYGDEGVLNRKGHEVVAQDDLGPVELLGQAFGFAPSEVTRQYKQNARVKSDERRILQRKSDILTMYAIAMRTDDEDMMDEVRRNIRSFNRKYPKLSISRDVLKRSFKTRERHRMESINGITLTKSLRELADTQ
jgi:hypothetical protein